jgi:hypothetical protein
LCIERNEEQKSTVSEARAVFYGPEQAILDCPHPAFVVMANAALTACIRQLCRRPLDASPGCPPVIQGMLPSSILQDRAGLLQLVQAHFQNDLRLQVEERAMKNRKSCYDCFQCL